MNKVEDHRQCVWLQLFYSSSAAYLEPLRRRRISRVALAAATNAQSFFFLFAFSASHPQPFFALLISDRMESHYPLLFNNYWNESQLEMSFAFSPPCNRNAAWDNLEGSSKTMMIIYDSLAIFKLVLARMIMSVFFMRTLLNRWGWSCENGIEKDLIDN